MTSPTQTTDVDRAELVKARYAWWSALSKQGDPLYQTNLFAAFEAGYIAASALEARAPASGVARRALEACQEKLTLYYARNNEYGGGVEHSKLQGMIAEALASLPATPETDGRKR